MTHHHDHHHDDDHGHAHSHAHHHHQDPGDQLKELRAAKDAYMLDPSSPLTDEQRTTFTGLSYYPPSDDLRLLLPLDTDVSDEPVTMQITTGGEREFHRAGKVRFEVDGEPAELTVFASNGDLFLPMRDATSKTETYPAGRYLEPEMIDDGHILVDFNYLYNPYCAYNEQWSCPIPPVENWLSVPIRAGEKRFE